MSEMLVTLAVLFCISFYLSGTMLLDIYTDDIAKNHKAQVETVTASEGLSKLTDPISNVIAKFFHLPDYKKRAMENDLERAGIEKTAEKFYADCISLALLIAVLAIPFALFGFTLLTFALPILGGFLGYKELTSVKDKLKALDDRIEMAFPDFAMSVTAAIPGGRNFVQIFSSYIKDVPYTPLRVDILRLVRRIETGQETTAALREFERSINLESCSRFVTTLILIYNGADQTTYLQSLNAEMRKLNIETKKRIIAKRAPKLRIAKTAMLIGAMLTLVTPIIVETVKNATSLLG